MSIHPLSNDSSESYTYQLCIIAWLHFASLIQPNPCMYVVAIQFTIYNKIFEGENLTFVFTIYSTTKKYRLFLKGNILKMLPLLIRKLS